MAAGSKPSMAGVSRVGRSSKKQYFVHCGKKTAQIGAVFNWWAAQDLRSRVA